MVHPFFHMIAGKIPQLSMRLRQADRDQAPAEFVRQIFMSTLYLSLGVGFALFMLFDSFGKNPVYAILAVPVFFGVSFFYFLKLPDVIIMRRNKEVEKEIIFAGKFLIVELKSGVPLYQAMKNIARNYGGIGVYFKRITDDIDLGTEVEESLNKAIVMNPSESFRKVMWQLANSIRTGSDISESLESVLEQISRRQLIEVERYGKKLNPIAMFYLMMAVIIPSLGMVMGVVLASFVNIQLPLFALLGIAGMSAFFQFMFYAMIKSSRPAVEM
ncbi:MAG: type II secretion system F family protein [Nanoarchaeota archaeon]